jgi:hypothetical protein
VRVFIGVSVCACCERLRCTVSFSKKRKLCERCRHFVHKYIIPSLIPFEILKTSLGTQIMLPSQFVDFLSKFDVIRSIV